jgi:hypothetical protein
MPLMACLPGNQYMICIGQWDQHLLSICAGFHFQQLRCDHDHATCVSEGCGQPPNQLLWDDCRSVSCGVRAPRIKNHDILALARDATTTTTTRRLKSELVALFHFPFAGLCEARLHMFVNGYNDNELWRIARTLASELYNSSDAWATLS